LPAHLSAHPQLSIPALDAFQLHLTPLNSIPTFSLVWNDPECGGREHRHIVLLVRHRETGACGALGISRRKELGYVEMEHPSVSSVVDAYRVAYERWRHSISKVRVGLPAEHVLSSNENVCWRHCCVSVDAEDKSAAAWDRAREMFDDHASRWTRLKEKWRMDGLRFGAGDGGRAPGDGGKGPGRENSNLKATATDRGAGGTTKGATTPRTPPRSPKRATTSAPASPNAAGGAKPPPPRSRTTAPARSPGGAAASPGPPEPAPRAIVASDAAA